MATLNLIAGRAGGGKTRTAIRIVRRAIEESGARRTWVVLPTRSALDRFTRALAGRLAEDAPGASAEASGSHLPHANARVALGIAGLELHTISSLALKIIRLAGQPDLRVLPATLRPMLVRQALAHIQAREARFRDLVRQPGYVGPLTAWIGEALQGRISSEHLVDVYERIDLTSRPPAAAGPRASDSVPRSDSDAAGGRDLKGRLALLASLLDGYTALVRGEGLVDPELVPDHAVAALRNPGRDVDRIDTMLGTLVIDGFTTLTESETALLTLLASKMADRAFATISLDLHAEQLTRPSARTSRALAYPRRVRASLEQYMRAHRPSDVAVRLSGVQLTPGGEWSGDPRDGTREVPRIGTGRARFRAASLACLEATLFEPVRSADAVSRSLTERLGGGASPDAAGANSTSDAPSAVSPSAACAPAQAAAALDEERAIRVHRGDTVDDEVSAVLAELKRLHDLDGIAWDEMAVLVRDLPTYGPHLARAATRLGIPTDLTRRARLVDTPLWWLTRDLIRNAITPLNTVGPATDVLRNPLFAPDTTSRLVTEARAAGLTIQSDWLTHGHYDHAPVADLVRHVRQAIDNIARALHVCAASLPNDAVEPGDPPAPPLYSPGLDNDVAGAAGADTASGAAPSWSAAVHQLMSTLSRELERLGAFDPPAPQLATAGAAPNVAAIQLRANPFSGDELDLVREQIEAQRALRELCDRTCDLLVRHGPPRPISLAEMRDAPLRGTGLGPGQSGGASAMPLTVPAAVARILELLGEAAAYTPLELGDGRFAGRLPVVAVDGQAAVPEVKVAAVVGLVQGVFPPPPRTDPVLPDRDRTRLAQYGLRLDTRRDALLLEDHLFYRAVTQARDQLLLSWSSRGPGGVEWLPSLYLRDVAGVFGRDPEAMPALDDVLDPPRTAGVRERPAIAPGPDADRSGRSRARGVGRPVATGQRSLFELLEPTHTATERAAFRQSAWTRIEEAYTRARAAAAADPKAAKPTSPTAKALDTALTELTQAGEEVLPWQRFRTRPDLRRWVLRTLWRERPRTGPAIASWHAASAIWDHWHGPDDVLATLARGGLRDPHRARLATAAVDHIRRRDRPLSASGLNMFANCPFKYFSRYHLDLDEPVSATPDVRTWGTLHHSVLEDLGRALLAGEVDAEPEAAADWAGERFMDRALDPEAGFSRVLTQECYRSKLREERTKLRAFVKRDILYRGARSTLPVGFEVPFGFAEADLDEVARRGLHTKEPLSLSDEQGRTARIRGYIDLLEAEAKDDAHGRRRAIVIDYKSGKLWPYHRKLNPLEIRDESDRASLEALLEPAERYVGPGVKPGVDFQLPIYILAVERLFKLWVAGAFFYSIREKHKRGRLVDGRDDMLHPEETRRWDYRPATRIRAMVDNAEHAMLRLSERIQHGEIAINPSECIFCAFRDLCRFDKSREDIRLDRANAARLVAAGPPPDRPTLAR